jgi:hypothetical protein
MGTESNNNTAVIVQISLIAAQTGDIMPKKFFSSENPFETAPYVY